MWITRFFFLNLQCVHVLVHKKFGTYSQVHAQVVIYFPNIIVSHIPEFADTHRGNLN